jgi:phosphoglycolate phosphatase
MLLLGGSQIEVINPNAARGRFRSALFDFDGTLSLIREGWQGVMIPMMVEVLLALKTGESEAELNALVAEYVARLTGKQTIYQMIELAEQVRRRAGTPLDPLEYKRQYLVRLWERIKGRVAELKAGVISPENMLVPGSLKVLEGLRAHRVTCYLASGTDEPYVKDEAAALGLPRYFGDRIHGAQDDYRRYSKAMVIESILQNHNLHGPELVTFGDGFVEIENTKAVGGVAVGVASNEAAREGIDEWKRARLIAAGADLIVPDFREADRLLACLFAA